MIGNHRNRYYFEHKINKNLIVSPLVFEQAFLVYFTYLTVYTFILALAGRLRTKGSVKSSSKLHKIAILVPAYKEDEVIVDVAKSYEKLQYPNTHYDVFIISDSMEKETVLRLQDIVKTIEVSFELSTKVKSLNKAFEEIGDAYDIVVINDADNIPEENFLNRINEQFSNGFQAIQGQRMAKNTNTHFAILDAISEVINNHIYRKGFNAIGLSSGLIGSGMAFKSELLKTLLLENKAIGGFDKVLQLSLVEKGIFIKYDEHAIVFDEKTESQQTFRKQRKRWLSSQFKYFSQSLKKSFLALLKGNINYFNLSFLATIMQPRILVFTALAFGCVLLTVLQSDLFWAWWSLLLLYIGAMAISIPSYYYQKPFFQALVQLPSTVFNLVLALLGLKNSDQSFIHTNHKTKRVNNIFYENWKKS